jgi:arginase family enzyme
MTSNLDAKSTRTVIQDFTGVYAEQPFMQGLRGHDGTRYIDCTDIPGTDCYCDDEAVEAIRKRIADAGITDARGIHFFDNGNYHYMSKIWTDMVQEPFTLVVFDHHPDMQEPRFGNILSCGGWVKKVAEENKFVQSVTLIGVADHLAEEIPPHDKVMIIRESEIVTLDSIAALWLQNDSSNSAQNNASLYISIDKDALSPDHAATNWDQGSLSLEHMKAIIEALAQGRKIIGVDICGERARNFAGDEHHSVQEADTQNDRTNRELADFLQNF